MKITLAKTAGFCFGVERAVSLVEEAVACGAPAKEVCHWMLGEMMRRLKEEAIEPKQMKLKTKDCLEKPIRKTTTCSSGRTDIRIHRIIFPNDSRTF